MPIPAGGFHEKFVLEPIEKFAPLEGESADGAGGGVSTMKRRAELKLPQALPLPALTCQ